MESSLFVSLDKHGIVLKIPFSLIPDKTKIIDLFIKKPDVTIWTGN